MNSLTREPGGGGVPAIGPLFSETLEDVTKNIQGYLMVGLALMAVAYPLGFIAAFGAMIAMYLVMGVGMFASIAGGAALGEASGDQDLGGLIASVGTLGSFALAFFVFFGLILLMTGAMAPLSGSMYRAIAAHQRGEAPLTFGAAFSTIRQDIPALVGAMMLVMVSILVGVLFCYVGALVPGFLFTFALPMVALHRKGAMESLRVCARHAMGHASGHAVFVLCFYGISLVANYIPLVGPTFLMALTVRAYRKTFGDGPEPVI